ncbi:MAG: VanZ family protein [Raoultibacter sp.]
MNDEMYNNNQNTEATSSQKKNLTATTVILWVLVVLWAGFIFLMSSTTGNQISTGEGFFAQIYHNLKMLQAEIFGPQFDALSPFLHFMEYFIFGLLLSFALKQHVSIKRAFMVAIIVASAYGITDEIHQLFVPGRDCTPLDWFVDMLGASFAALIAFFVQSR